MYNWQNYGRYYLLSKICSVFLRGYTALPQKTVQPNPPKARYVVKRMRILHSLIEGQVKEANSDYKSISLHCTTLRESK
jgi:hypothetical protein